MKEAKCTEPGLGQMEAIILAGGLGTRLGQRLGKDTGRIPKPMVEIGGCPLLVYLMMQLQDAGCSRVLLSVGHLHEQIENYFGPEFNGMRIDYIVESQPLGTGGAIRKALRYAMQPAVMVINGDTLTDVDFKAMLESHARRRAGLTMAVVRQIDVSRYGKVLLAGDQVVSFVEKGRPGPGWINAGIYVVSADLTWPEGLPEKFSFERDFLAPNIRRLNIRAEICGDYFIDVGVPEDLDRAQREVPAYLLAAQVERRRYPDLQLSDSQPGCDQDPNGQANAD